MGYDEDFFVTGKVEDYLKYKAVLSDTSGGISREQTGILGTDPGAGYGRGQYSGMGFGEEHSR